MKFRHHTATTPSQWHLYKQLELIPESVQIPHNAMWNFTFGLRQTWRWLLIVLTYELIDEQQVDYLERCWALNETIEENDSPVGTLQRLWTLME
ncbi:hypothetical protein IQ268_22910 [Oculatella sp. LEGE 06141]|uniref:hypothetical protein n=1 Tax=Oculatella sp. LEGE 06141 TaxID=1828648 RepID=UPI0018830C6D|nr:hypothetical protein [Oculatella sp. LEGE 06141]MBE9181417.1 hypothetical protein [Oculatella sp. LEGE 06141]